MKILVKVKAGARIKDVAKQADGSFVVFVKEPPREGKANEAARTTLAAFLDIPKTAVRLIRGAKSKNKTFEIDN